MLHAAYFPAMLPSQERPKVDCVHLACAFVFLSALGNMNRALSPGPELPIIQTEWRFRGYRGYVDLRLNPFRRCIARNGSEVFPLVASIPQSGSLNCYLGIVVAGFVRRESRARGNTMPF